MFCGCSREWIQILMYYYAYCSFFVIDAVRNVGIFMKRRQYWNILSPRKLNAPYQVDHCCLISFVLNNHIPPLHCFSTKSLSGCPRMLHADTVVHDPSLPVEIDELRKMNRETNVEDFTMLDDDE